MSLDGEMMPSVAGAGGGLGAGAPPHFPATARPRAPLGDLFSDAPVAPACRFSDAARVGFFDIHNRRYLGGKHKLLPFIQRIVVDHCGTPASFCDIFAGTGCVGARFNSSDTRIIANDILQANHVCLHAFLAPRRAAAARLQEKIAHLNNLSGDEDNYFSRSFGGTFFTVANARKIGQMREEIDSICDDAADKNTLLCALLYATDKVANTVGHYDAYRRRLDMTASVRLLMPCAHACNDGNVVYCEDANRLIRRIACDVLYIDPPYNSRQYSDAYHLLENLAEWKKPALAGIARKMDRAHIKSAYCTTRAAAAFADLIANADCRHILLSYNNTGSTRGERSNARLNDEYIMEVLSARGKTRVYEQRHKAYTTGRSQDAGNAERVFYCEVR